MIDAGLTKVDLNIPSIHLRYAVHKWISFEYWKGSNIYSNKRIIIRSQFCFHCKKNETKENEKKNVNEPTVCWCSVLMTLGIFNELVRYFSSFSSFPFGFVEALEYLRISLASDISGDDNWLLLQLFGIIMLPDMLFESHTCVFKHFVPSVFVGVFWFIFGQFGWWHLILCGDNVNVSAFGKRSSSWFRYLLLCMDSHTGKVKREREKRKENPVVIHLLLSYERLDIETSKRNYFVGQIIIIKVPEFFGAFQ